MYYEFVSQDYFKRGDAIRRMGHGSNMTISTTGIAISHLYMPSHANMFIHPCSLVAFQVLVTDSHKARGNANDRKRRGRMQKL